MKILHVGWWRRPYRKGGLIIYAESLMREQQKAGHEIYYFCGGRYIPFYGKRHIKKYTYKGVYIYEVVNSPNLIWDYSSIKYHISNPDVEEVFRDVIAEIKPDVIHIQELESLSADMISICSQYAVPTVMSLHNYWPLCPQRDLIDSNGAVCYDWENGLKCIDCKVLSGSSKLQWLLAGYCGFLLKWPDIVSRLHFIYFKTKNLIDTQIRKNLDQNLFTERRHEFVKRLNTIQLIAVSNRVNDIYSEFGVRKGNIKTIHISSNAINFIRRKKIESLSYPIKFGYIGSIDKHKGVHILIEAFKKLDQTKCVLFIYGGNISEYVDKLKWISRNYNIIFKGGYQYEDLNNVLSTIDVGIVPQIWEDNSPQVVLELLQAGVPVIGSNIGGIPDFIRHGINGFLSKARDVQDLAEKMDFLVNHPEQIILFSSNTMPHKTLKEHCTEIIELYKRL